MALFAGRRPGLDCTLVNTRPPSAFLGAGALELPPGPLAFHLARVVVLAAGGWALLGRFAPRDVLVLCELASRFAGGEPPPRGLPPERAGAFLDALRRAVPPATLDHLADLGRDSAAELATLDPVALAADVERSATRLALLHTGDLHGALLVQARLPRPGSAPVEDGTVPLSRPDLAELARFALSDPYLEMRARMLGWS